MENMVDFWKNLELYIINLLNKNLELSFFLIISGNKKGLKK